MSSVLGDLLKEMRAASAGIEKQANGPDDPPPVDQTQKSDPISVGQDMLAKIENFLQAAQNAAAVAPPNAGDPNAQVQPDPNAQQGDPNAQAQAAPGDPNASTVTLQVPANAIVKIAEEITTKDVAIAFLTTCGLVEGEK